MQFKNVQLAVCAIDRWSRVSRFGEKSTFNYFHPNPPPITVFPKDLSSFAFFILKTKSPQIDFRFPSTHFLFVLFFFFGKTKIFESRFLFSKHCVPPSVKIGWRKLCRERPKNKLNLNFYQRIGFLIGNERDLFVSKENWGFWMQDSWSKHDLILIEWIRSFDGKYLRFFLAGALEKVFQNFSIVRTKKPSLVQIIVFVDIYKSLNQKQKLPE